MTRPLRAVLLCAVTGLLLLVAAPAWAHVTVRTDNPEPGAFSKYTVRVPNERDDAGTTQIELEIPDGVEIGSYQPAEGWDVAIADGVITISGGVIEPGQFQEFSFSGRNPEEATELVFPSLQTYEGGEVVRWVGEPDADEPAPVVAIGASNDTDLASAESDADSAGSGILQWIAVGLGLLGVTLGSAALARSRRGA